MRNEDRERLRNEGEAYANDVIPRARGTASRLIEEANAAHSGNATILAQLKSEYEAGPREPSNLRYGYVRAG